MAAQGRQGVKRAAQEFVNRLIQGFAPVDHKVRGVFIRVINKATGGTFQYTGPKGILARPFPTGTMAFWAITLLVVYLVLYLVFGVAV